jgi:3-methyl-2-oxobutanoate hydroxymethyltransferase
MSIITFQKYKDLQEKISMLTCYDYTSAKLMNQSDVNALLVGDTLAMLMYGYPNTIPATIEMMALHTGAVARGAPDKFIVSDMPFLSYRKGLGHAMNAVEKLVQAGAQAIKLEGVNGNLELIQHIVESGIPVMGHLGLIPQSVNQLGGFRLQGKQEKPSKQIFEQAKLLEQAGCFATVLECIPTLLGKKITEALRIPTIGIGAGPYTDGQILVFHDLLGFNTEFKAKFVRTYMKGSSLTLKALNQYHREVREGTFPSETESYS